jgi:hypothetical protein
MITNLIYKNENNKNHDPSGADSLGKGKAPNFSKAAKYDNEQLHTNSNFRDK